MRTNKKKDKSKKQKYCAECDKPIPDKNYKYCDKCKRKISRFYFESDPPVVDEPEITINSIGSGSGDD